jgi:CheY-specific phosphatase CheX
MNTHLFLKSIIELIANISAQYFLDEPTTLSKQPYLEKSIVIHDSNVANILICNQDIRIIFKIHYNHNQANEILKDHLDLNYTTSKIDDYFLEVCNLIAGKIKINFKNQSLDVGISIPLKTAGFDELFFPVYNDEYRIEYCWSLKTNKNPVVMSAFLEVMDSKLQSKMTNISNDHINTDDDVEFF